MENTKESTDLMHKLKKIAAHKGNVFKSVFLYTNKKSLLNNNVSLVTNFLIQFKSNKNKYST